MAYFRISGTPNDLLLLPPSIRNHQELANVVARSEALVIAHYTNDPPYFLYTNQLGLQGFFDASWGVGEDITNKTAPATAVVAQVRVYLRGYKQDASDPNVDPNLAIALRWAISEVIRWVFFTWFGLDLGVQSASEGQGSKQRTFRPEAEGQFPTEWMLWLLPYDSRQLVWGW